MRPFLVFAAIFAIAIVLLFGVGAGAAEKSLSVTDLPKPELIVSVKSPVPANVECKDGRCSIVRRYEPAKQSAESQPQSQQSESRPVMRRLFQPFGGRLRR